MDAQLPPLDDHLFNEKPALKAASGAQRFSNYVIDSIARYLVFFGILFLDIPILAVVVLILYYPLSELMHGKSLGKVVTQTHVITVSGKPLTIKHTAIRSLCRLIPFEAFSVFEKDAIMWHDAAAGTRVVQDYRERVM